MNHVKGLVYSEKNTMKKLYIRKVHEKWIIFCFYGMFWIAVVAEIIVFEVGDFWNLCIITKTWTQWKFITESIKVVYWRENSKISFRWVRILEDREARDDEDSYSGSSAELVYAFSVRVIVGDDEHRAIARTKEALVGSGASSCQGLGGIPQDIRADGGFDSLTFTWSEPDCDQTESAIISYEYTVSSKITNTFSSLKKFSIGTKMTRNHQRLPQP